MKTNGMKDSAGRPIVVVTGMGLVSSLGRGKEDNWKKLTSGVSGIHRINRFPLDGLKTTIAGTVDFLFDKQVSAPELSEKLATLAAEEAVEQSGVGSKGNFPGPLFCAVPPVEMEWPQRRALAAEADAGQPYTPEIALAVIGAWRPSGMARAFSVRHRCRSSRRYVRHQGFADFALDRVCLGRHGDPVGAGSDPPR